MATPLEAIRDGLLERLREIRTREPGARLGSDPEALHEMRVAVRRTRALFRTGRRVIGNDTAALEAWLKALGGVLGEVRDLDVLIERLAGAETVVAALSAERSAARERLLRVLDSHEYRELLAEADRTANALRPNGDASTLDELVDRQAAKLRKAAKALPKKPSDDDLHAFRKRVKRTRYAAELAGNAKLARRAKRLQDVLGEHQDAVFAAGRLREFGEDKLAEREEERQVEARAKWPKVWKRLRRAL